MFMFAEPLQGWRHVRVRAQRTKVDWALEMEALLRTRYAEARKVLVVCDNLNTHTMGAFYEAFAPEVARQLVRRIEFRYTPKHGSWLNIAENELSSLYRQCLKDRRFFSIVALRREVEAWSRYCNNKQRGVQIAQKGIAAGQTPFGAVIVRDCVIVAEGHNCVWLTGDPTAHAEVVAIRKAATALKAISLSGSVMYTTCEPCPMCLSAIHW